MPRRVLAIILRKSAGGNLSKLFPIALDTFIILGHPWTTLALFLGSAARKANPS
jgi:hypothetical protein